MAISITPLIGHKEYLIDRRTDGGEVVALIQCSGLIGGNFGGQGGDNRIAQGIEPLCEAAQKCGIGPRILGVDIFKIHIQPPVALFCHRPSQLPDQPLLEPSVLHQRRHQIVVKAAVCTQGRQDHHGIHTGIRCLADQPGIIGRRRDQCSLFCKAVGKNIKICQKRKRLLRRLP